VIGLWKWSKTAVSRDEGHSWTPLADVPTLVMAGAKIWGQRTPDGRWALVYNPVFDNKHRWPLALVSSGDGVSFDHLLAVNGEVPPRRYSGVLKDYGTQYVRGIAEGNGRPPGDVFWVAYSMNKEDIWVSRIPVPLKGEEADTVDDSFGPDRADNGSAPWHTYSPLWAPVEVAPHPTEENHSLRLADRDPHDYAMAARIFPESTKLAIDLRLQAAQNSHGQLFIEVQDRRGLPAVRIIFDDDGQIKFKYCGMLFDLTGYQADAWYELRIVLDTAIGRYNITLNGEEAIKAIYPRPEKDSDEESPPDDDPDILYRDLPGYLINAVSSVERLVLRTGPARTQPTTETTPFRSTLSSDLANADEPVKEAVFYLNHLRVTPR